MNLVPQALLLDFGSVLTYSLFEQHRSTERALGLPAGSLRWLGPLDPATDALWQAMQRDEISEREYWARRAGDLGRACGEDGWDMRELLRRTRLADPASAIRVEMRGLLRAARTQGLRTGILSNELELFYGTGFLERTGVAADIDAVIDGSVTGVLKPAREAYDAAVETLGTPAARTLFVDDQFRNIAGAQEAGLQTQLFDVRDAAGCVAAIAARLRISSGGAR